MDYKKRIYLINSTGSADRILCPPYPTDTRGTWSQKVVPTPIPLLRTPGLDPQEGSFRRSPSPD